MYYLPPVDFMIEYVEFLAQKLKEIYTFNALTTVDFMAKAHVLVCATGALVSYGINGKLKSSSVCVASDGGKLQLWDINSNALVCEESAHEDRVTVARVRTRCICCVAN